jgi:integrase
MATPKPWQRKSTGIWYVQIGKKQIKLGSDEGEAWRQYHRIVEGAVIVDTEPVASVLDAFLDWVANNQAPGTYEWYRRYLRSFHRSIGSLSMRDLKPYHVTRWVDAMRVRPRKLKDGSTRGTVRPVSATVKADAITAVKRALNWAVEQGFLDRNPIGRMRRPQANIREDILTEEQWKKVLAAATDKQLRDFLTFMRETGCRPQEVRILEASFVQDDRCVYSRQNSKGKRHNRVILLTPTAKEIVDRLSAEHPTGPIFRNREGNPWKRNAITHRMRRIRKTVGFPVTAYTLRHTFATDALVRGVDAITVATLMGHQDTTMVSRVYQHLPQKVEHLQKMLMKATGASDGE